MDIILLGEKDEFMDFIFDAVNVQLENAYERKGGPGFTSMSPARISSARTTGAGPSGPPAENPEGGKMDVKGGGEGG